MSIARKVSVPSFVDEIPILGSVVARWRSSMAKRDHAAWTDECIDVLAMHSPHLEAGHGNTVELVQRQLLQGERLVHAFVGRTPGDSQAIEQYRAGVAAGFYALDRTAVPASFDPVPGSPWRSDQLRRLRQVGLSHGAVYRKLRREGAPAHRPSEPERR